MLNSYLNQIKIGGEQVYKNLVLFPLLSNMAITVDYFTLDETLAASLVGHGKGPRRLCSGTPD